MGMNQYSHPGQRLILTGSAADNKEREQSDTDAVSPHNIYAPYHDAVAHNRLQGV